MGMWGGGIPDYMGMWVHVETWGLHYVSFNNCSPSVFWDRVSEWTRVLLGSLTNEHLGSAYLCFSNTGTLGEQTLWFLCFWDPDWVPQAFEEGTLYWLSPSPQPYVIILLLLVYRLVSCQLYTWQNYRGTGISTEKTPPGIRLLTLTNNWWRRAQPTVSSAASGQGVLDGLRKQAQQGMKSKPVNSIPQGFWVSYRPSSCPGTVKGL